MAAFSHENEVGASVVRKEGQHYTRDNRGDYRYQQGRKLKPPDDNVGSKKRENDSSFFSGVEQAIFPLLEKTESLLSGILLMMCAYAFHTLFEIGNSLSIAGFLVFAGRFFWLPGLPWAGPDASVLGVAFIFWMGVVLLVRGAGDLLSLGAYYSSVYQAVAAGALAFPLVSLCWWPISAAERAFCAAGWALTSLLFGTRLFDR